MVTSGPPPLIVYAFRRVRRRTSTDALQTCDAGRARVQLPSEAGTPDMTIGRAAADRAGARPYLRRQPTSGQSFLERFLTGVLSDQECFRTCPFAEPQVC